MTTEDCIHVMVDRIVNQFHPLRVILFGSFARGDARSDSDVDLLVVFPTLTDDYQTAVALRGALADVPVAKDIVVTTPAELARRSTLPGDVLRPAAREGKVLYDAAALTPTVPM